MSATGGCSMTSIGHWRRELGRELRDAIRESSKFISAEFTIEYVRERRIKQRFLVIVCNCILSVAGVSERLRIVR